MDSIEKIEESLKLRCDNCNGKGKQDYSIVYCNYCYGTGLEEYQRVKAGTATHRYYLARARDHVKRGRSLPFKFKRKPVPSEQYVWGFDEE